MLIKTLLDIQSRYGYLPEAELKFLALRAGVPLYRVQEVTTFFPHFRREPPPRVTLHVCQTMSCHVRGARQVIAAAQDLARQHGPQNLEVHAVSCLGRCDRAPAALCGQNRTTESGPGYAEYLITELGVPGTEHADLTQLVADALAGREIHGDHDSERHHKKVPHPGWQIDVYYQGHNLGLPPFEGVRRVVKSELTGDAIIKAISGADLVGMGGAAARTGKKWEDVRSARGKTRYVVCNGDESEPGTFKDREILLHSPHLVVEGMILAALTIGASHGYIYLRHEYHEQAENCRAAIAAAKREVPEAFEEFELEVFVSPGRYICGEETALIEVIEGKRAQPRNQPPDIRQNGLFDQPTLVNNVETYAWVPAILLRKPAEWYRDQPLRFFSISGDLEKPGAHEMKFSETLGNLIDRCGGVRKGLELYAVAPSGPSGGFLPARLPVAPLKQTLEAGLGGLKKRSPAQGVRVEAFLKTLSGTSLSIRDLPLDVALFRTGELSLGAGIVVYSARPGQSLDMLDHTLNLLRFFEGESCGKCVPCRLGCQQLVHFANELHGNGPAPLTARRKTEVSTSVRELTQVMEITSICGLGRAASVPFGTWLDHFATSTTTAAAGGATPEKLP